MDKQKYYVSYRGYVYLTTEIEAENAEEAEQIQQSMPYQPTRDMELTLHSTDFDFELDYDNLGTGLYHTEKVPKKIERLVCEAAYRQSEVREAATKQRQREVITKQIDDANAQLLVATKSVTDTISKLKNQLDELSK